MHSKRIQKPKAVEDQVVMMMTTTPRVVVDEEVKEGCLVSHNGLFKKQKKKMVAVVGFCFDGVVDMSLLLF